MKDWTGNGASARALVGVNRNYTTDGREEHDYYATDPIAAEELIRFEYQDNKTKIWECACGEGHLAKVFAKKGFEVKATDLIDRGYGEGGKDFLQCNEEWDGDIVTNPPYKVADLFVEHALELVTTGHRVCMFLKLTFLEGIKRQRLYKQKNLKYVYVAARRIGCGKNGQFDRNNRMMAYAWYVFEKGFVGEAKIRWMMGEEEEGDLFG